MIGAIMAKQSAKAGFAALNRRDLSAFMAAWADDSTFLYPGELSVSGKCEGKKAIQGWFENFLQQFPQLHFTLNSISINNIFALSGNNVVAVQWDFAATNRDGLDVQNSGVTMITIKNAKAVLVCDYLFRSGGEIFRRAWGE